MPVTIKEEVLQVHDKHQVNVSSLLNVNKCRWMCVHQSICGNVCLFNVCMYACKVYVYVNVLNYLLIIVCLNSFNEDSCRFSQWATSVYHGLVSLTSGS